MGYLRSGILIQKNGKRRKITPRNRQVLPSLTSEKASEHWHMSLQLGSVTASNSLIFRMFRSTHPVDRSDTAQYCPRRSKKSSSQARDLGNKTEKALIWHLERLLTRFEAFHEKPGLKAAGVRR